MKQEKTNEMKKKNNKFQWAKTRMIDDQYLVSSRMSALSGLRTLLHINSCVTGMATLFDRHKSDR